MATCGTCFHRPLQAVTMVMLVGSLPTSLASADEGDCGIIQIARRLNTVWVLPGAFLVVLMQAGFGILYAGLLRAKSARRILAKNLFCFSMVSPGLMFHGRVEVVNTKSGRSAISLAITRSFHSRHLG